MSPVHSAAVAVRRLLARRPWIHWLIVVAVAMGAAATVHDAIRSIDAERDSWGATRPVLVTTEAITAGEAIRAQIVEIPLAVVPAAAIDDPDELAARTARQRIGAGEIVTEADLAVGAGPLALVPPSWRAVPIVESTRSGAEIGERVEIVSDGFLIDEAVVVGHLDDVTLVAVPSGTAPLLPAAAESGSLTLVRVP